MQLTDGVVAAVEFQNARLAQRFDRRGPSVGRATALTDPGGTRRL